MQQRQPKKRRSGKTFWNKEYKRGAHITLSENPSEDLLKFTRFLAREYGRGYLNPTVSVLDVGCGNGRNLIYLAENFNVRGIGYDTAEEAIKQAKQKSEGFPLTFAVHSIANPFPLPNESQAIVLDMMSSHMLSAKERERMRAEIARVLKPGGFLFIKTFLRDEDRHAARLLKENPADEAGSYIHPEFGVVEHVFTEGELIEEIAPYFTVRKILKSHQHERHGHAWKRRSIAIYAEKVF